MNGNGVVKISHDFMVAACHGAEYSDTKKKNNRIAEKT